ncbi:hypothetical protein X801_03243 [Opisthorchis viverrini]|uniref:Kinesin motor domain-containing protein n=1 Tax=Opisthorchis viverrini TaxID=6198 RepID=A0A1S8X2B8_OPIVI|nr:hypothetical protein X801_03243 [Opisthorchis viverrini]
MLNNLRNCAPFLISLVDPADEGDGGLRSKRNRNREYTFDHAFDETSTQEEVFRLTTFSLIEHVANGFNATVFASGSTVAILINCLQYSFEAAKTARVPATLQR